MPVPCALLGVNVLLPIPLTIGTSPPPASPFTYFFKSSSLLVHCCTILFFYSVLSIALKITVLYTAVCRVLVLYSEIGILIKDYYHYYHYHYQSQVFRTRFSRLWFSLHKSPIITRCYIFQFFVILKTSFNIPASNYFLHKLLFMRNSNFHLMLCDHLSNMMGESWFAGYGLPAMVTK